DEVQVRSGRAWTTGVRCTVGQGDLVDQPGLRGPRVRGCRTTERHPNLAGPVPAENGPVLDQRHLEPLPSRGDGGTDTGHAAADHDQIELHAIVSPARPG